MPLRGTGHERVGFKFVPKNSVPKEIAPMDFVPVASAVMMSPARAGRRVARAVAMVLLAVSLGACSNLFDKDDTPPDQAADRLYNEGLFYLNVKHDPKEAAKKFEEVDRQHPYSEWARKSLIMGAYAYYQAGSYEECVSAARREKALGTLEEVIRKYPNSEYAVSAKQKIEVARDQLAGKEMQIGRYYMDQKDYTGAINRFKVVVTKYQTTRHVEEALMRLTESYMALGIVEEAQTAAAVLGHNFPDSVWYKHAYTLVKSGGGEPTENRGSWISRAFKKVGLG